MRASCTDRQPLRAERGQALPLVVLLVLLAGAIALVLAEYGRVAVLRARASAAADAAALAGAVEGREAAAELADRNGAVLERFSTDAKGTVVTVRIGKVRATARARIDTVCRSSVGVTYTRGLCPPSGSP